MLRSEDMELRQWQEKGMPEDHLAPLVGSVQPVEEGCACSADMEIACWRWCKADSHLYSQTLDTVT